VQLTQATIKMHGFYTVQMALFVATLSLPKIGRFLQKLALLSHLSKTVACKAHGYGCLRYSLFLVRTELLQSISLSPLRACSIAAQVGKPYSLKQQPSYYITQSTIFG
jgi:hypothetical protein